MRSLRSPLLALSLLIAAHLHAQTPNYTTNITLNHLLGTGGPVSSAVVCVVPSDVYGNPIAVAASTWGLIPAGTPVNCGPVASGAITGGINVPDAAHTYASGPIYYNFTIQVREFPGGPIVQKTMFKAVPNVTGATFSLDQYTPAANLPYPMSNVVGTGSSVPSTCTSPSLFLPNNQPLVYTCNAGTYQLVGNITAGAVSSWSGSVSYPLGAAVLSGGQIYYSSVNANLNNAPSSSPSDWTTAIFDPAGAAAGVQTNLNTEASTRTLADTTLQSNINNEASARASADTAAIATAEAASAPAAGSPNYPLAMKRREASLRMTRLISINHLRSLYLAIHPRVGNPC